MDIRKKQGNWTFSSLGHESTEIFYHMLGKGIVFSPTPVQMRGFSSLGIVVHPPPDKWLQDGFNGHAPWLWQEDATLHNAVLPHNGVVWGNTQTPEHALQKVLLGKQRQFGTHIPATPYGLIAFVPVHADLSKVTGVKTWWHTDGISIWRKGGEQLTGQAAAQALRTSFAQAAKKLPFHAKELVFLQTLQISPHQYRLFVIDPNWLNPTQHVVTIHAQIPETILAVTDVLSNETLQVVGKQFTVVVPTGSLRILDVKVN